MKIHGKGQLTIPTELKKLYHLVEGDYVEFEAIEGGILLKPKKMIDASQAWFWTQAWQRGEREASADIEAGRVKRHRSDAAFLKALGRRR